MTTTWTSCPRELVNGEGVWVYVCSALFFNIKIIIQMTNDARQQKQKQPADENGK